MHKRQCDRMIFPNSHLVQANYAQQSQPNKSYPNPRQPTPSYHPDVSVTSYAPNNNRNYADKNKSTKFKNKQCQICKKDVAYSS